jgi:hypothetical protein
MELASLVEKMDTTVQNAQSKRRTKKEEATGTAKDCSKHREKGNSISVNSECTSEESSLKITTAIQKVWKNSWIKQKTRVFRRGRQRTDVHLSYSFNKLHSSSKCAQ